MFARGQVELYVFGLVGWRVMWQLEYMYESSEHVLCIAKIFSYNVYIYANTYNV